MTLHELLVDEIRDLYHAEKQLTKALPRMAKAATHQALRSAFASHLEETRGQITRLEEAFAALDEKVKAKPCAGMAGILEEGADMMKEDAEASVMDAGLIASAQRAEHYEIAAYGSCAAWAKLLGLDEVAALLEQNLAEEKATDQKLSALAESAINQAAADEGRSDDADDSEDAGEDTSNVARMGSRAQTGVITMDRRQTAGALAGRAKAADKRRR